MRNHLRKHPTEFLALSSDKKEKNIAKGKRTLQDTNSSTVTMRKKLKTQMSFEKSVEAGRTWDMNSRQAQHITKLIGEMIVLNNQQLFLIAEDLGFMHLMKHVAPRYHLASQHHFSDAVIPNLVKRAEAAVAKMLEKAKHFSFTSDIWTCSHNNDAFISLTAHWIDENETKFPRQSIVLQSSFFPGSHTGPRITEKFTSMLSKWTIDSSRCYIVVTDNASNMTNAVQLAGLTGSPCFIHTLQLAISDAIFSQRSVSNMIAKAKRMVTHFRHSTLGSSRLAELQSDRGHPKKKLIQDVATRRVKL
ncbi:zinc finger BED domain-containing protein 4-like [Dendronephthya gigantea]|uniref:zinc finger BED domain-containing protein 4-like n=1 Tax=Dendronephthya gigantea TaxID=151771 RepID=UPI00106D5ADA|nr:zinc finger BED domain-containing protein 4-like [Dendronephthya gigantea]